MGVEVPPIKQGEGQPDIPAVTKLYGNGAIYGMTFVDEATARLTAAALRVQPVNVWDLREGLQAMGATGRERLGISMREPE